MTEQAKHTAGPTPLNGTKTHPLSRRALDELHSVAASPKPRQYLNPGVANRLEREVLIEVYSDFAPFKTKRGEFIRWVRITDAGRAAIAKAEGRV